MPVTPVVTNAPIVLYDGRCGLCNRSVQYLLARDRSRHLRFAPLDGTTARDILRAGNVLATADSVVWYEPQRGDSAPVILVRSTAVIRALRYLGWPYKISALLLAIPRPLRDGAYDFIAAHRHRRLPQGEACVLASPEHASRFLP